MMSAAVRDDARLLGLGMAGVLSMAIVYSVQLFNGQPPDRSALRPFEGEIVDSRITDSRGRIYAELRVRGESGSVILSQRMPENLARKAVQPTRGSLISALIAEGQSTDATTGLARRSLWELWAAGAPVVSFEELSRFHSFEAAGWRMFSYVCGVAGAACLALRELRRRRRVDP